MWKRSGIPTLYLLVVFACGAAVGGFGHRFYEIKTVAASAPRPPEEWKKRHMQEMRQRLHLTDAQSTQLSGILDQIRSEYHDLMEKSRPDFERIQTEQYNRVKAILTPDQIPEYDKFHAERERQRQLDRKRF